MRVIMSENQGYTKKCFVCRKKFQIQDKDLWGYKKGKRYFCSYGCLRRFERTRDGSQEGRLNLGKLADDLFDVGWGQDEVRFKIIGTAPYFDNNGFQQTAEVCEIGQLYDISKGVDGKITLTLEIKG